MKPSFNSINNSFTFTILFDVWKSFHIFNPFAAQHCFIYANLWKLVPCYPISSPFLPTTEKKKFCSLRNFEQFNIFRITPGIYLLFWVWNDVHVSIMGKIVLNQLEHTPPQQYGWIKKLTHILHRNFSALTLPFYLFSEGMGIFIFFSLSLRGY